MGRIETSEYRYTEYGETLIPVLDAAGDWGLRHLEGVDAEASTNVPEGA